ATVTGVQTCALPISELVPSSQGWLELFLCRLARVDNARQTAQDKRSVKIIGPRLVNISSIGPGAVVSLPAHNVARRAPGPLAKRSEERRVGEGSRSG